VVDFPSVDIADGDFPDDEDDFVPDLALADMALFVDLDAIVVDLPDVEDHVVVDTSSVVDLAQDCKALDCVAHLVDFDFFVVDFFFFVVDLASAVVLAVQLVSPVEALEAFDFDVGGYMTFGANLMTFADNVVTFLAFLMTIVVDSMRLAVSRDLVRWD